MKTEASAASSTRPSTIAAIITAAFLLFALIACGNNKPPEDAGVWVNRVRVHLYSDEAEALIFLERAEALAGRDAHASVHDEIAELRVDVQCKLFLRTKATADGAKCLALASGQIDRRPGDGARFIQRAKIYLELGDPQKAEDDIVAALDLYDPKRPDSWRLIAIFSLLAEISDALAAKTEDESERAIYERRAEKARADVKEEQAIIARAEARLDARINAEKQENEREAQLRRAAEQTPEGIAAKERAASIALHGACNHCGGSGKIFVVLDPDCLANTICRNNQEPLDRTPDGRMGHLNTCGVCKGKGYVVP